VPVPAYRSVVIRYAGTGTDAVRVARRRMEAMGVREVPGLLRPGLLRLDPPPDP
jgi:hypothetical protein